MHQIKDQIFSDFHLSHDFKQYYCMATQSSPTDKNTLRFLGGSVLY